MKRQPLLSLPAVFFFAAICVLTSPVKASRFSVFNERPDTQQPQSQTTPAATDKRSTAPAAKSKPRRGAIKGRVVDDGGQPIPSLDVRLFGSAVSDPQTMPMVKTDEDGRFEFKDLRPGFYSASATAPGYYTSGSRQLLIGDEVTLTLTKGGVITGMVRDAAGEPLPGVPVGVARVQEVEGKIIQQGSVAGNRFTDDRGIYRIFGLNPGIYRVAAGGRNMSRYSAGDIQTYYPSSTREAAAEVVVTQGQETSGIDITLRDGKTHIISGTVIGVPEETDRRLIFFNLRNAASGMAEEVPGIGATPQEAKFELRGIEDGEYLLTARLQTDIPNAPLFDSEPVRVKVRGADVTGLRLALARLGAVSGRGVLEKAPTADSKAKCEGGREASLEEMRIVAARDAKEDPAEHKWQPSQFSRTFEENGGFVINGLAGGRYRFYASFPSWDWYLKEISQGVAARGRQPLARRDQQNELIAKGVLLKAGGHIEALTFTIAEGAAAVSGKIVVASEGEKLPAKLRIYLVPAEKERADDLLSYAQTQMWNDGTFIFRNLAPGKYWLLTKEVPNEEALEAAPRRVYWEAAGRQALRKEAEAENNAVGLQSCQQVKDFSLRHKTRNASVKAVGSGK